MVPKYLAIDVYKRQQASAAAAASTNYMWHSFWLLMRRSDRSIVGSAVWKGAPDASGQVEIGYGLGQRCV